MSMSLTSAECEPSTRRTCVPAFVDEVSCRVFLCARCRSRVLVCRRCDRGQIYCVGTCAQEARRSRQREARRRYQALREAAPCTPSGIVGTVLDGNA
jgi:hypothetical protein